MNSKKFTWILVVIILILIVLVILFWDDLVIKKQDIIEGDYCELDEDCVWAVNPYYCCVYPVLMNKEVVELDEEYEFYVEGTDYNDYDKKEQCFNNQGQLIVGCTDSGMLSLDLYDIYCVENKCIKEISIEHD